MAWLVGILAIFLACLSLAKAGEDTTTKQTMTRRTGAAVGDNENSLTCGASGGILLQDVHLVEKLANFARERIPERVVHARGTGAHGIFESYGDYSRLTSNPVFSRKGKKTPTFVRFSTVIHGQDSPESLRDPRGFATRFYTEAGNWDLVFNNLPVFFIRDTIKFPDLIHSLKPDPVSNSQDPNRFFDFLSYVPESTKMLTYLYSDKGTPYSYRFMPGSSVHAYKFVNKSGVVKYVKLFWKSLQGEKNFTAEEASQMQAKDFGHATRDLYMAINKKKFPSWELQIQELDPSKLNDFDFNPLDSTKDWPEDVLPKKTLGKMTLNRVPDNFQQFTEQFAPCPANIVPGVEFSEDRMLQGRAFSYSDAQRYRLGINHFDLPVNRPLPPVNTYSQRGFMDFIDRHQGTYNYEPNSDPRGYVEDSMVQFSKLPVSGTYMQEAISKTLNFAQAGELYRSYSKEDRSNLISNLAGDLGKVRSVKIKVKMAAHCYKADMDYGTRVAAAVSVSLRDVKAVASSLKE